MASREVVAAHVPGGTERALLYKVPAGLEAQVLGAFVRVDWDAGVPDDRHIELGIFDPNRDLVGVVIPAHNDAQGNIGDLTNRAEHALWYLQGDRDFDILSELPDPTTRTAQSTPGAYFPEYWTFEWLCIGAVPGDQMSNMRCIVDERVPDDRLAPLPDLIPPYTSQPLDAQFGEVAA